MNDMTEVDVNDFTQEKECIFKGEHFSVRDNGAVFRHQRNGKRARPNDNKWTFGKENSANPYLHISNIRIHRIVATAFHGDPPDPKYVVDHIDSNCRNNRPENLRWLTRLENALKNPATRKKIEYSTGTKPSVSTVANSNPKIMATAIASNIGPPPSHRGINPPIVVAVVNSIGRSLRSPRLERVPPPAGGASD